MVSIYVAFLMTFVFGISLLIVAIVKGKYAHCYIKFVIKNVMLPLAGAIYVHEIFQYLPIMSPITVKMDFKRFMFVWEPTVEVSSIRGLCGWILGFVSPFVIGILLLGMGNGIVAIPFLLVSISGIVGILEGLK
ncbi:hypothetical protein [Pyrococcus yayanosii]|nr:hypothetical protein [Pyrococcus yayanosii]